MATDDRSPGTDVQEPSDAPDESLYPLRWWALVVLCLSLLIVFVGNSSLNVALPTLSRELGATTSQLQWVVAIYSLVFAGLLFTTGALGDRYGRKGALQFGLALFLVGCGLASMATSTWQIIACRAIMGAAAAFIMPSTLSIIVNIFPPHERTKAIAIWAGVTGAAGSLGPLASGFLLGHFWFGSVFLVNVPIVIVALISGWFLVPKSRDPEKAPLDPIGAVLSIIGISSLVYGLIQAPDAGWGSPATITAFGIAVAVLTLFVLWELHTPEPMLDMRFFKNRAFSVGTGGMILVFLSMYGVMFLLTQYFQLVLGYSPLSAAIRLLPLAPIMIVVAPMTPRLSARFGSNRVVAAGMVLDRGRVPHVPGPRRGHVLPLRADQRDAHRRGHVPGDVADDRRDHVLGPDPAGRCRLGDERRLPRARRRPGRGRAGQRRRVEVLVHPQRPDLDAEPRASGTRPSPRWPVRSTPRPSCPSWPARR